MAKSIWITRKTNNYDWETQRLLEEAVSFGVHAKLVTNEIGIHTISNIDLPDVVLARTGSGTDHYSMSLLRELERHNIHTVNSSQSIDVSKDKFHTYQKLSQLGISTPKTILINSHLTEDFVSDIGFPCVLKPNTGSHGGGISLCHNFAELLSVYYESNTIQMVAQEYIGFKKGTDLRVLVIGNTVIGAMQRINENDFRANIALGGHGQKYTVDLELEELAINSARSIGLEIAGVDVLFTDTGYTVLEINSAPGFKGFEEYTKVNVAKSIIEYASSII
jgi:gamma-F420-2:alpha-L-glutamate ligase